MNKRIAYADPPYLGCANLYSEKREVDHQKLMLELETYDAWALSCSVPSLRVLLPMCPGIVRVAAWVKPFASFKPNVNPAYAWEPVLFRPLPRAREVATVRDWLSANITIKKGLVGAKPPKFCYWLFELLGANPDDEFCDLFPGTGVVTKCWESWRDMKRCSQKVMEFSS